MLISINELVSAALACNLRLHRREDAQAASRTKLCFVQKFSGSPVVRP